jgi:hypothetical protein
MGDAELADPLGRTVVLHDRTWFGHIVRVHPELAEHRGLVEAAVSAPTEIRHSRSDPNCRIYYGPGPRSTAMMQVIADLTLGIVKTAHFARRITGGDVEWST